MDFQTEKKGLLDKFKSRILNDEQFSEQKKQVEETAFLTGILNAMPFPVFILNNSNCILFVNNAFYKYFSNGHDHNVIGLKPGEALCCERAFSSPEGCGSTKFCQICGAAKAILSCYKGESSFQECIITSISGITVNISVWTESLVFGGNTFYFLFLTDISSEKRRRSLEKIFFHDIMNDMSILRGFVQIMKHSTSEEMNEYIDIVDNVSENIVEDIKSQQDLTAAENNELQLKIDEIESYSIIKSIAEKYREHEICKGRKITISPASYGVTFETDKRLLKRVIGNLVKNALEASEVGSEIILTTKTNDKGIVFKVANPGHMSDDIQLQIFARSFSTKGKGRGLGTYSVRLLTERYLKGQVWFKTSVELGTSFYICIPYTIKENESEAGENINRDKAS
ncbi:MAG: PAS domain-containing sensor histidine kinase [Firmicutes bacterium]|nr:PAS domain-containing sensor histidine kinase [Bacillota bacterium]